MGREEQSVGIRTASLTAAPDTTEAAGLRWRRKGRRKRRKRKGETRAAVQVAATQRAGQR